MYHFVVRWEGGREGSELFEDKIFLSLDSTGEYPEKEDSNGNSKEVEINEDYSITGF